MNTGETESYHFDKAVKSSRTKFLNVVSMIVIATIIGFGCTFVLCAWGSDTKGESGTVEAAGGSRQMDTDPVGGTLAYYISKPINYRILIFVVYALLASMSFAIILRYILFWLSFRKTELFLPTDDQIKEFTKPKSLNVVNWQSVRETVLKQDKEGKSFFWASLKDGVLSRPIDQESKYDQLIVFFRHRVNEIMFRFVPRRAYDTISAISPATGFFGTLLGLLYIFGTMRETMVHPSRSEEFATGLTVAVITSLWGLFNLGLAVLMSYFAQCRVDRRAAEMELQAKPVTALAERCTAKKEGSVGGN